MRRVNDWSLRWMNSRSESAIANAAYRVAVRGSGIAGRHLRGTLTHVAAVKAVLDQTGAELATSHVATCRMRWDGFGPWTTYPAGSTHRNAFVDATATFALTSR